MNRQKLNRFAFPQLGTFNFIIAGLFFLFCISSCSSKRSEKPKVLVFSKTSGFHHTSIADGNKAILKLGEENGFEVDTTTNAAWFNEDSLKQYSAVVFLSTTGDVLDHYQEADFERYIQSGGGYVGIHAASDTEFNWGWYGRLVGGYFNGHPKPQEAALQVLNSNHEATKHLPQQWKKADEWYNFKNLNRDVHVLINLDEHSYEGGTNGKNHPIAWYHDYDGGRVFYTGLGHTEESYTDALFLQHILGGIKYAIGNNEAPDYSKATTLRVPEEDRFEKTVLTKGTFYEPTEMTILPNLDILVTQRRGEIMLYNQKTGEVNQVGFLDVYHSSDAGINAEEGLLGIAADPDFKKNNFVYMFYSPADTSVNRLSRFVFRNGEMDMKSEKVILQFYSQRDICCHTGGSIAFGPGKILYLSTGDNSTPFNEPKQAYVNHGYAPLDERKGHEQYDARRSASNTNDLRGKIIRIKVKEDGTYEIPDGNLFKDTNPNTKPEIYTMGHRNPYRISVDPKNGYVYWGDVGPDARVDSLTERGPRGYDEINQARAAGYFGWPLFIGNNYSYHKYDYATGKPGPTFDPQQPVNDSPNNTGLRNLPPAQPAYIWYPYGESEDFPEVGAGGRTSMAGPVYYTDLYPEATRYNAYYNGKLIIYDWIRNWFKVVTMQPNGDLDKIEPFVANLSFSAPSDVEVGPDGKLYVLEYGKGWFTKNNDSGLARIDYLAGNRPPKIKELQVEKISGSLPFILHAKVDAIDPEKNNLRYVWKIGKITKQTTTPTLDYTIATAGDYEVSVDVFDDQNASAKSNVVNVYGGNEQPEIAIALQGNKSFYFTNEPVKYKVSVSDKDSQINLSDLYVSADYIEGKDLAGASMGHQELSEEMKGKSLMLASDCKACHKIEEKSVGPAFQEIAQFYKTKPNATSYLTQKILKGGSGVWGDVTMPAHPDMKETEVRQIVNWIKSLASASVARKSLPAEGEVMPKIKPKQAQNTVLKLVATYTDQVKANSGIRPLTGTAAVYLRSNVMEADDFTEIKEFNSKQISGSRYLVFPGNMGWISEKQLDLTGIKQIELLGNDVGHLGEYQIEVRLDKVNGQLIGDGTMKFNADEKQAVVSIPLQSITDKQMHDIYIISKPEKKAGKSPLLKSVKFL